MKTQTTTHPLIHRIVLGGALITTLSLGACAVYPTGYGYGNSTVVTGPVVRYAPPPPRVEVMGVAPFFGAVWLPGNWVWRDRWVWNEGHWGNPPHPNARWAPGRWDHDGRDNWRWHEGRWR